MMSQYFFESTVIVTSVSMEDESNGHVNRGRGDRHSHHLDKLKSTTVQTEKYQTNNKFLEEL